MSDGDLAREQQDAFAAAGGQLLQDLHVGIWMVDGDGVTTYVNRRMSELLGTTPDQIVGRPLLDYFLADDHQLVLEHVRRRRQGTSDHYDARVRRADGSLIPMRVQGSPVVRNGEFFGSVAALTDLSDLSEAASDRDAALRAAEESNLTKTRFLSWVSHELRTPLSAITGFAQVLEDRLSDPTDLDMVRSILAAGNHVTSLVQDLLDYSKAEANVLEPALASVAVADALDDAIQLVSGSAHEHGVTIDAQAGDQFVLADRRHLVQVLVNLLSNAVKYGSAGATVRVRTSEADGLVRCSVADEGPGIPAGQQRLVFRPFERLDNAKGVPGVGLGLPIAESFMRAMHGALTLVSAPGAGAVFTIELPSADRTATPAATIAEAPAPATRVVLYVEDEPLNAALMESIVGLLPGRTLRVEPTAAAGIAAARQLHPALILLDLHLPDGSGFDVLAAIRADPSLARTPVFVLSADATDEATGRARDLGVDRFITKPFNLKEFVGLLDDMT